MMTLRIFSNLNDSMIYDLHPHMAWQHAGSAVGILAGRTGDLPPAARAWCYRMILHYGEKKESKITTVSEVKM